MIWVAVAGAAAGAIFTNRQQFVTANPGLEVIDFEGLAPPGSVGRLIQPHRNMTFEGGEWLNTLDRNLVDVVDSANDWGSPFSTPSDIALVNFTSGYVMRINLDGLYGAVGLLVKVSRTDNVPGRVRAFSNGTLVGEIVVPTSVRFDTFVGFTDARGIDRIEVSSITETRGNTVMIDDLHYGIPVEDTSDVPIPLKWMPVGDAGNPSDSTGYGAVGYNFRIAKHEVTNALYAEFLNAVAKSDPNGLYHPQMAFDPRGGIVRTGDDGNYRYTPIKNMANKPVNYTSFLDAARMANWLHNGKGNGDTETGAYDIASGPAGRLPTAKFFVPSENEWYKAAYYNPGDRRYRAFATRSYNDPTPAQSNGSGEISNPGPNVANYDYGTLWGGIRGQLTTVGSAGPASDSYYGTADQSGNLGEWNESLVENNSRASRGGAWYLPARFLRSDTRIYDDQDSENSSRGFRLAAAAPEVSITLLRASAQEDGGEAIEAVLSRNGDLSEPLDVAVEIGGNAVEGTDYTLVGIIGNAVTIPEGESEVTLRIQPIPNGLAEGNRNVTLALQAGNLYNLGTDRTVIGTILDDDFAPVGMPDNYQVVEDRELAVSPAEGVLANDSDEDDGGGPANIMAELSSGPSQGEVAFNPDGSFTYTPNKNFFGSDRFIYRASDGTNRSVTTIVDIQVMQQVAFQFESIRTPNVATAPGVVIHTFELRNLGPSDATGLVVDLEKLVPAGLRDGRFSSPSGRIVGNQWLLDLREKATAGIRVAYVLDATIAGGIGVITTTLTVRSVDQPIAPTSELSERAETNVISVANVTVAEAEAAPALNAQTGLFTHQITVTNHNALPIAGLQLRINDLPEGVKVYNQYGLAEDGVPYIDIVESLQPGASVTLTIELFRPDRTSGITPAYTVAAVFPKAPAEPVAAEAGENPTRLRHLENGDVLIEFESVPGTTYAVEYSQDLITWHRVIPAVIAAGTRTQWIDNGQPKTPKHPRDEPARYYRIFAFPVW